MKKILLIAFLVLLIPSVSFSWTCDATVTTKTAAAIHTALSGQSGPYRVCLEDGAWNNIGTVTLDENGSSGNLMIISPETPNGATLTGGSTRFVITGNYWKFEGFTASGFNSVNDVAMVTIEGDNNRVTDTYFRDSGDTTTYHPYAIRVQDTADDSEIDHNTLDNWRGHNILVTPSSNSVGPDNTHIHHNYFVNMGGDDISEVGIFSSGVVDTSSDFDGNDIIEWNVFNGYTQGQSIETKHSSQTIRYNVLYDSFHISLRHGDDILVFNNWVIGTGATISWFLQVCGANHKIINNHVQGTDIASKGIYLLQSDPDQEPVENLLIQGNTFAHMDNGYVVRFALNNTGTGPVVTFRSNIITADTSETLFRNYHSGTTITWSKNLLYTTGTYFSNVVPVGGWPADGESANQMTSGEAAGLWTTRSTDYGNMYVLDSSNIAIEAGYYDASYPNDFDGQARDGSTPDIGADEYSVASPTLSPPPANCVGPTWADGYQSCAETSAGPVRTVAYPTSQQACGSDPQTVEIGLTTDVNADCKYDTDGNEAYADMANTFSTTGTTSHSQDISQACGGSTVYYVRCTDGSYPNLTDIEITVDVAAAPPPPSAGINWIIGGSGVDVGTGGGGLTITSP